jgi:hypothetical protein
MYIFHLVPVPPFTPLHHNDKGLLHTCKQENLNG